MVNTINPADCDRNTVYTGECRNAQDTEWVTFDSGRRRSPNAHDGNSWLIDVGYGSFWQSDDEVRNLIPLVPELDAARLRRAHSIAEAERDQAREQRDVWKERAKDAACDRADAERSEAAMERQRDEAHQACALLQLDVLKWRARAEKAERELVPTAPPDNMDVDPVVYVVRESDLPEVEQDEDGDWLCESLAVNRRDTAEDLRGRALSQLKHVAMREAVARAIEAEQAVDPLLGKAQEFAALADWELTDREAELLHTVAAHVLGQEAGDE